MRDGWYASSFLYFQLEYKLDILKVSRTESYRGSFSAIVISPELAVLKISQKSLLYFFDCSRFRQYRGKSKFTIYIFSCKGYV